jgi:head-tail adaptor
MSATQLPGAGDLNRRIQLRLRTDVPNAEFGVDETYSVGIPRWAKKEPIHSISIRAGQNTGEAPTDFFWVRWGTGTKPTDLTEGYVIDFDGRRYRVMDSIDVDDLHRFTRITAKDLGAIPP